LRACLLDYGSLRDHRVRPLALLNDSKQLTPAGREELFRAVLACCSKVSVRAISAREIDSNGLHRSNLAAMRAILWELAPPAEICLVDGFRLGPTAPEHKAVVDGDEKSAAIAAASVVAKVVRDRTMRRLAALYPHYGFSSHVGYITPGHSAVVRERGPSRSTAARSRRAAMRSSRTSGSTLRETSDVARCRATRRIRMRAEPRIRAREAARVAWYFRRAATGFWRATSAPAASSST
jgi:ribonuclease HII